LPKYRGAAPVNWAIINGETETGLTAFFLKETVDTGDIFHQQRVPITANDTFDSLYERLCAATGPFLLKTLERVETNQFTPVPQTDDEASYAPRLRPEDALIDFGFPAENVRNFIRGMATRPGAYTFFRGRKLKVHFCEIADTAGAPDTRPGTILPDRRRLLVQCNRSAVALTKVVPAGKREMDGQSFLNGYHPQPGEVLGEKAVEGEVRP
ncbi:MAG: methionyl-tRNA formyltransferase, partial [Candidatus Zixiibacteriota bacterium]